MSATGEGADARGYNRATTRMSQLLSGGADPEVSTAWEDPKEDCFEGRRLTVAAPGKERLSAWRRLRRKLVGKKADDSGNATARAMRRLCQWVVGVVLIAIGSSILGVYASQYMSVGDVIQAECSFVGFQAEEEQTIVTERRPCETQCGFAVVARDGNGLKYAVNNFMPRYDVDRSVPSGKVAQSDSFACCPTSSNECCQFQDQSTGLFCDNFGGLRQECPRGPWKCYFDNSPEFVRSRRVPGRNIVPGDRYESVKPMTVGAALCVLGLLILSLLRPSRWWRPCILAFKAFLRSKFYWKIARSLPREFRTEAIQKSLECEAAVKVQRWWRVKLVRRMFQEAVAVNMERLKKIRFMEEEVCKWNGARLFGPFSEKAFQRRYFYDTGSDLDFRRVVHSRVLQSPPGSKLERREVLLNTDGAALAKFIVQGEVDVRGRTGPPRLSEKLPQGFRDLYDLQPGDRLLKVDDLEFPQATARQLRQQLRRPSREPTLLLLEGRPRIEDATARAPMKRRSDHMGHLLPPSLWKEAPGDVARRRRSIAEPSPPPMAASLPSAASVARARMSAQASAASSNLVDEAADADLLGPLPGAVDEDPAVPESAAAASARSGRPHLPTGASLDRDGDEAEADQTPMSTVSLPLPRRSMRRSKPELSVRRASSDGHSPCHAVSQALPSGLRSPKSPNSRRRSRRRRRASSRSNSPADALGVVFDVSGDEAYSTTDVSESERVVVSMV